MYGLFYFSTSFHINGISLYCKVISKVNGGGKLEVKTKDQFEELDDKMLPHIEGVNELVLG